MVVVVPKAEKQGSPQRAQSAPRSGFLRTVSLNVRSAETLRSGSFLVEKRQQKLINGVLKDVVVTYGSRFDVVLNQWLRFAFFTPKDPLPVLPSYGSASSDDGDARRRALARVERNKVSDDESDSSPSDKYSLTQKADVFKVPRRKFNPEKFKQLREALGNPNGTDDLLLDRFRHDRFLSSDDVSDCIKDRTIVSPKSRLSMDSQMFRGKVRALFRNYDGKDEGGQDAEPVTGMACRAASHALLTSALMTPQKANKFQSVANLKRDEIQAQRAHIMKSVTVPSLTLEGLHACLTHFGVSSHETSARIYTVLCNGGETVQFPIYFKFVSILLDESQWSERNLIRTIVHSVLGEGKEVVDWHDLESDLWNVLCPAEQIRLEKAGKKTQVSLMAEILRMLAFGHHKDFERFQQRDSDSFKLFVKLIFPLANDALSFIDEELLLVKKKMRNWALQAKMESLIARTQREIFGHVVRDICRPNFDNLRMKRIADEKEKHNAEKMHTMMKMRAQTAVPKSVKEDVKRHSKDSRCSGDSKDYGVRFLGLDNF